MSKINEGKLRGLWREYREKRFKCLSDRTKLFLIDAREYMIYKIHIHMSMNALLLLLSSPASLIAIANKAIVANDI